MGLPNDVRLHPGPPRADDRDRGVGEQPVHPPLARPRRARRRALHGRPRTTRTAVTRRCCSGRPTTTAATRRWSASTTTASRRSPAARRSAGPDPEESRRCQSAPKRSARSTRRRPTRSGSRRSASTRTPSARPSRSTTTAKRPRQAGFRDVVAPPMFAVVYSAPRARPGDPRPRRRDQLRGDGPRRPGVRLGRAGLRRRRDHDPGEGAARSTRRTARASTSSSPSRPTRTATRSSARPGRTSSGASEEARNGRPERGRGDPGAADHPRQVPAAPLRRRLRRLQPDPHRQRLRDRGRPAAQHPPRPLD